MGICIYRQNNKEDDLVTDKELKKLSRLELLELLLTESRENERLREELEKIKHKKSKNFDFAIDFFVLLW